MTASFIKSRDTKTPVTNSKAECERILRRYGARGFNVSQNFQNGKIIVSFVLPDTPEKDARLVPVTLPVDVRPIFDKLYTVRADRTTADIANKSPVQWQHAERVAWRNLVLWIDAALSASAVGLQTITEAFFAHVALDDGQRVIEAVTSGTVGPQLTRLLSAGKGSSE